MNKNIWIIANWKSNKTIAEALEWVAKVGPEVPKNPLTNSGHTLKIVICPSFSSLSEVTKEIRVNGFNMMVGAQDLSPFEAGAYTGEEAASLIKDLISLSILGHSERRQNFNEDNGMVTKKVGQALKQNITPLVCIQGPDTPVPQGCKLIAYEPIFAIGTGNPDTPDNAQKVASSLKEKYGQDLEVLYGGSVTSENIRNFIEKEGISGVLVGKASLDALEFIKMIKERTKLS